MSLALQHVWLDEFDAERNEDDIDEDAIIVVHVDLLALHDVEGGPEVDISFSVEWLNGDAGSTDDDTILSITATFRLIYEGAMPRTRRAAKAFVSRDVLRDVWPVWRTWLAQTLALMAAPAPSLPGSPPKVLVEGALHAYDHFTEAAASGATDGSEDRS